MNKESFVIALAERGYFGVSGKALRDLQKDYTQKLQEPTLKERINRALTTLKVAGVTRHHSARKYEYATYKKQRNFLISLEKQIHKLYTAMSMRIRKSKT